MAAVRSNPKRGVRLLQPLRQAAQKITQARDIVIAGHRNPDGDSLGSLLSLGLGLKQLGKRVAMVSEGQLPQAYASLPGYRYLFKTIRRRVDLAIAVDCGSMELLGDNIEPFLQAGSILQIDHHKFGKPFGDIRLIDYEAAAVGELIYLLLKKLRVSVTSDIAYNILTSVVVETSSFRTPHVRPFTFEICAKLLKTGVDFNRMVETLYWNKTKESAILSGVCLARCKFLKNGRIVWSLVTRKDFQRVGGKEYDVDSVAEEIRSIKGVEIVVLFREENAGFLRVSLRSKGKKNVSLIARKFNGGGHFDVAGCYISNTAASKRALLDYATRI